MQDNTTDKIVVTDISWERIFLLIEIESRLEEPLTFKLRKFKRKLVKIPEEEQEKGAPKKDYGMFRVKEVDIEPERVEGNKYYFRLNMSCLDGRSFLGNGRWQIVAYLEGMERDDAYVCSVSNEIAYQLDDKSRIYRYGQNRYAYTVSFNTVSDYKQLLSLVLFSQFVESNPRWKERRYVKEVSGFKKKLNRLYKALVIKLIRGYYKIVEHFSPKKGDRVMFMTETKGYLWGNLMYIDNKIKDRGLDKKFKLTYSLRESVGKHKGIMSWIKLVTKIAKQDFIFVDDYVPIFSFLDLTDKTKLIQVWHAGEGFKAVGYCRFGKNGSPYPEASCHKKYDYVITGSRHFSEVLGEVFGIPQTAFKALGMPRLDGFLDKDKIETFKKGFYEENPTFKGKKLILFAPTYRGTGQASAHYDYRMLDMERIYEFLGDEYIWAFKMHPFIKESPDIPEGYEDRIVDLSYYENINDLYYVTDILITDYSSNYFEYALMRKPVLFYTYDREIYELTRGVHRPVRESAPGKVCDSFDELMEALEKKDYEEEKIEKFVEDNFSEYDGDASNKIIDEILLKKGEEDG